MIVLSSRIIYRILEKSVYVVTVLDSRQNVEDIIVKKVDRVYAAALLTIRMRRTAFTRR